VLTLYPNVDDLYRRFWALGHFGDLVFAQPDGSPPESERIYATVDGTNWFTYPVTNMPVETMAKFIPWNGDTLLMAMENRLYIWANGVWAARTMPFGLTRWGRGMHVYEGRLYGAGDNGRMYRWQRGSRWELVCDLPVNADSLHCGAMATLYGRVFLTAFNPFHGYEGKFLVSASIPSGQLFSLPHDFGTETTAGVLSWDDVRPGVGDVAALQLRSGATIMEMATSPFVGPDGTSATYYETSPAPIGEGHHGDRYFQYRVQLRCPDETWMPLVKSVTLEVDSLHSGAVGPEPSGRGAAHLRLDSIAPNPVQNLAHLRFSLVAESDRVIDASSAVIHVRICDLQGRRIRGASVRLAAGRGEWRWDLRDDYGHRVTAGVYRAVLSSADGILPASRAWVVM
jgi:hypothetical protein